MEIKKEAKLVIFRIVSMICALIGLVLLILSIVLKSERNLFLSLGLAFTFISNIINLVWSKKLKEKDK